MSKTKQFLCKAVLFCVLFSVLFFPIQGIFVRKSLEKPWDMTNKISGFYNEPENEFSVMYFGSSHAYASFSPLEIWKQTGVKSYVFATQMQPMWASVTYLKEALKTQKPKLVVFECNMLYYEDSQYMDDATNYSFMDDIPLSANKIELAQSAAPEGSRLPLVLNFVKYHSRWANLTKEDFTFRRSQTRDPYKGFVVLPPKVGGQRIDRWDLSDITEPLLIGPKNSAYLKEMIDICAENGIDLWLVKAPCNIAPENYQKMLAVQQIADKYGIPFNEFNSQQTYDEIGITSNGSFFDQRHMDIEGATKFNDYFAKILMERYPGLPTDPDDPDWQKDYETYQKAAADAIANPVQGSTSVAREDMQ